MKRLDKVLKFPVQPAMFKGKPGLKVSGTFQEISAMGAGSVEGTAGGFIGFTDEDNEKHRRDTKK